MFHIHKWSSWGKPYGKFFLYQIRTCKKCGMVRERLV